MARPGLPGSRRQASVGGSQPPPRSSRTKRWRPSWVPSSVLRAVLVSLPALVLLAPVLGLSLSTLARDWALSSLGYGVVSLGLWVGLLYLGLSYKRTLAARLWRVWAASGIGVAISLGLLSFFYASTGVMEEASLGGHWGGYLGGEPVALGALKVAALFLLAPVAAFPRPTVVLYRRGVVRSLRAGSLAATWTFALMARVLKRLLSSLPSRRQATAWKLGRLARRISLSVKRSRRSAPGATRAATPAPPARTPSMAQADEPDEPARPPEPSPTPAKSPPAPPPQPAPSGSGWRLPSPELLRKGESRPVPSQALQDMAHHIEGTLAEHRVEVSVQDIRTGPRVIRFGLVPGWTRKFPDPGAGRPKASDLGGPDVSRVKVQSILVREKDLALALKTPYLRMEAPVPGEALVGLEVPNPYPRTVVLRSVTESPPFQKIAAAGGLPVALGEDTAGEPVVSDLAGLPHLLIAGATGSGKSVCINAIVASLLLTNAPERMRIIMVDPKRVELTPFNGIPHLVGPVIVDTGRVLVVLRAIQREMLHRYRLMEEMGVRNIDGYNSQSREHMPRLVLIIDELADLMMAAAYEVEQSLVRLAQLGRATGIHLILATQRPSVNVVTGLLKANVPSRIAFAVASQVDSRVILDGVGAEKLLGKGDALLLTSDSPKPKRIQGTFVDDGEIDKVVEFWTSQSGPPPPDIPLDEEDATHGAEESEEEDDLLDQARRLADSQQPLSTSLLQRRLRIGYSRAARLMEVLEEEGSIPESTVSATRPDRFPRD